VAKSTTTYTPKRLFTLSSQSLHALKYNRNLGRARWRGPKRGKHGLWNFPDFGLGMASPTIVQPPKLSLDKVSTLTAKVRDLQITQGCVVKVRPGAQGYASYDQIQFTVSHNKICEINWHDLHVLGPSQLLSLTDSGRPWLGLSMARFVYTVIEKTHPQGWRVDV
jgi:hypothetical protein